MAKEIEDTYVERKGAYDHDHSVIQIEILYSKALNRLRDSNIPNTQVNLLVLAMITIMPTRSRHQVGSLA
jgi:hypothetical protein